jgi:hypothetical protein
MRLHYFGASTPRLLSVVNLLAIREPLLAVSATQAPGVILRITTENIGLK